MAGLAIIAAALMSAAPPAPSLKPVVGIMTDEARRLRTECLAGGEASCIHLGILERRGLNAPRDPRAAIERFVAACEKGVALACAFTGDMAYLGSGVAQNKKNGEILMRGACGRDNEWACETMRRYKLVSPRDKALY